MLVVAGMGAAAQRWRQQMLPPGASRGGLPIPLRVVLCSIISTTQMVMLLMVMLTCTRVLGLVAQLLVLGATRWALLQGSLPPYTPL